MTVRAWGGAALALSPRDRRALLLGAGLVTCLLVAARGWPAYRTWSERGRAEAALLTREAARAKRLARVAAAVRDTTRARAGRLATYEVALIDGTTPASAAAELGFILREAADDAGLEIGPVTVGVDSSMSAAASDGERYTMVRASAEATGVLGAVTTLLEDLEVGGRALRVREFALDPAAPTFVAGIPPGADAPAARLRVRMVVEGVARRAGRPWTLTRGAR